MYVNILGQATVYILKYMYKCQLIADFDKYLFINIYQQISKFRSIRGWSGGAMVLDKLPVPGRPSNLADSRARAYCACSGCGWGLFGHFYSHLSFLSSFPPSLRDGPI